MTLSSFNVKRVAAVVCLLLSQAALASATDYFVANNGADSRSCTQARTVSTPKQSINSAVRCLAAGDTLQVRGGVYAESIIDVPSGSSWSAKVRIAAYPGETVWIRPSSVSYVVYFAAAQQYIEFDGINLDGSQINSGVVKIEGWSGGNAHHIRMQNAELIGKGNGGQAMVLASSQVAGIVGANEFINLKLHRSGSLADDSYAFYINSSDNVIDSCDIYDIYGAGIHIYNGYGAVADNNTVRNNTIHDILSSSDPRTWGVIVATGDNNKVYNNIIYNVGVLGYGNGAITVFGGASNTKVFNNTVYGSLAAGIYVIGGDRAQVINNISYLNAGGNYINNGTNTYASNNLTTDPGFVNAASLNFALRSGSPAIDQGVYVAEVQSDKLGVARPQGAAYDVGAYEYRSGSAPTPPPSSSGASPDGTRVPSSASIVDNALNVWTIGSNNAILRNSAVAAGGSGSQILWFQGDIYVLGNNNGWWKWTGSGWASYGPTEPAGSGTTTPTPPPSGSSSSSANGTRVPSVSSIIDNALAVWTIGSSNAILRNGVLAAGGYGSQILWFQNDIYVLGNNNGWWKWTGSGWTNYGAADPSGSGSASTPQAPPPSSPGVSPSGTTVPTTASSIVDASLAVWTIGSGKAILRNGVPAGGGYGSQIFWSQNVIYVLGNNNGWWRWSGSAWISLGSATPI